MGRQKKKHVQEERNDSSHRSKRNKTRSRATRESFDTFTEAITALVGTANATRQGPSFKSDLTPIFNPEDRNQSAENWCRKVDELRMIFDWSEEATIYFALSKLKGLAEVWYRGLTSLNHSWGEWKVMIQNAFPSKRDYYERLIEMTRRRKRTDESLCEIFP